jgi:hypothetical protein
MFWLLFQGSLAGFLGGLLLIALSNLYGLRRLPEAPAGVSAPRTLPPRLDPGTGAERGGKHRPLRTLAAGPILPQL